MQSEQFRCTVGIARNSNQLKVCSPGIAVSRAARWWVGGAVSTFNARRGRKEGGFRGGEDGRR
jgi:hypothetical protein